MTKLKDIGEFGLIERIRNWTASPPSDLIQGIGDDVAVIEVGSKILLATTDILNDGKEYSPSCLGFDHFK